MRNGDFIPNRLQAQQDAVHAVCRMKTKLNAENTVGLMSLAEWVSDYCGRLIKHNVFIVLAIKFV